MDYKIQDIESAVFKYISTNEKLLEISYSKSTNLTIDSRVEDYIRMLNQLYNDTGLLIQSDTNLYEINEPNYKNKVVATVEWNNESQQYYARYIH